MSDWIERVGYEHVVVFVPGTRAVEIACGVRYRPVRSSMTCAFAGEGLRVHEGDRAGCLIGEDMMRTPFAYVHRLYWHPEVEGRAANALLAYPGRLGPTYTWQVFLGGEDRRFDAEEALEEALVAFLTKPEAERV